MIDDLKQNIETEIEILREISNNMRRLDYANLSERKLLLASIESLKSSMRLINNSIPKLLEDVSGVQKLPQQEKTTLLEKIEFKSGETIIQATVQSRDRERLLKELSISESLIRKIKKKPFIQKEKYAEFKSARGYLKLSNRIFLRTSQKMIDKGRFKSLSNQLKKANIDILFATYISMILLTTLISLIVSFFIMIFFVFFQLDLTGSIIAPFTGNYLLRFAELLWIPIIIPAIAFFAVYFYPRTEKNSLAKKIERELPFAVIHMSAVSGSGIEPSELFRIIGMSKEYPYLKKEFRKVLNQINLYGYDLVTALNNVSKTTPSSKLSELFAGLGTTITSGSEMQNFFEKRSETLLVAYRLEREKYTKMAETFMDIYISVVIAAPMILMIMLVMIFALNINTGFSITGLTLLMLSIIAIINIIFIGIMNLKQPNY